MTIGLATKQRRFRPTLRAIPEVLAVPTPKDKDTAEHPAWTSGTEFIVSWLNMTSRTTRHACFPALFVTDHTLLKVNIMTL